MSVKYRGQVKTCARCHKTERDCPGKAVARDCQETRVLLSTHMHEHWQSIGFVPDQDTESSDDIDEVDIHVGKNNRSYSTVKEGPDLSHRYKSLLISGLHQSELDLNQIYEILLKNGLPNSIKSSEITINEKSHKVTVNGLEPGDCLTMMESMHGKRILNKKVFVAPIVAQSPVKSNLVESSMNGPPIPPPPPDALFKKVLSTLKLKTTRNLVPTIPKVSDIPVVIVDQKSIQSKESMTDSESQDSSSSPSRMSTVQENSNLVRKLSVSEKRKFNESPEKSDLQRTPESEKSMKNKKKRAIKKSVKK